MIFTAEDWEPSVHHSNECHSIKNTVSSCLLHAGPQGKDTFFKAREK